MVNICSIPTARPIRRANDIDYSGGLLATGGGTTLCLIIILLAVARRFNSRAHRRSLDVPQNKRTSTSSTSEVDTGDAQCDSSSPKKNTWENKDTIELSDEAGFEVTHTVSHLSPYRSSFGVENVQTEKLMVKETITSPYTAVDPPNQRDSLLKTKDAPYSRLINSSTSSISKSDSRHISLFNQPVPQQSESIVLCGMSSLKRQTGYTKPKASEPPDPKEQEILSFSIPESDITRTFSKHDR